MTADTTWQTELDAWLAPFLARLRRSEQRRWAPLYVWGLLGPGERKSVEPIAGRVAPGEVQQLHHFVSGSPWSIAPLEAVLAAKADELVGGPNAVLVVDDTGLPKQGKHSVGVARQYCGQLGKRANCQVLVSLTLARGEVPVPVGLRLYLPEVWCSDAERRSRASVPGDLEHRPKWRIALDDIDRLLAAGVRSGCVVADAGYGACAAFRRGLVERGLTFAVGVMATQVGVMATQKVYPRGVTLAPPVRRSTGRPPKHAIPSTASVPVQDLFADGGAPAFEPVVWRVGSKGPLTAEFAALRVRGADGPANRHAQHLPGDEAWLACEKRADDKRKYYLCNHPADAALADLAAAIKARWVCEQAHQQLKQELGLGHYEGRGWIGLHHHLLLAQIAFAFLQHLRLRGKKPSRSGRRRRSATPTDAAASTVSSHRRTHARPPALPLLPAVLRPSPAPVSAPR
jgi:SRSO17 transposase